MKVIAFNGSPKKAGNTARLLQVVLGELEREGIETEVVQVGGEVIRGCTACKLCKKNLNERCVIEDDMVNECIAKMKAADGILVGSPVYFSNLTPEIKALLDRSMYVARCNNNMFRRKVGAAVAAVRRAGSIHTLNSINHYFLVSEMVVPGSSYWNLGIGNSPGEVEDDEEGMRTMRDLGQNMAWLLKRIEGTQI